MWWSATSNNTHEREPRPHKEDTCRAQLWLCRAALDERSTGWIAEEAGAVAAVVAAMVKVVMETAVAEVAWETELLHREPVQLYAIVVGCGRTPAHAVDRAPPR